MNPSWEATYILFYLLRHPLNLRTVPNVAPVELHAIDLALRLLDIQHGYAGAAQAVHLGDERTEPACSACNDNHLFLQVYITGQTVCDAPIDIREDGIRGNKHGPGDCKHHGGRIVGRDLRAEA